MGKRFSGLRRLGTITVLLSVLVVLGSAADAVADPGRAGLTSASDAVYPLSQVVSGLQQGIGVDPSGSATIEPTSSLPFTGLAAPVLLGVGLIVLAGGLGLRLVATRRQTAAPPTRH
jgi:hypothetical protein